jgi:serine/threonine-protein kinase
VLGTPSYMSPEQFADAQNVDARADIWGMGATLFELLTGVPPFSGTNLAQLYTAVMHRPIPSVRASVPELPEGLAEVVATCLTRERELRYADVAELASALEPYGGDAARDHVERIQRVVSGARQSTVDAEPIAPPLGPTDTLGAADARPGSISSTFARRRSEGAVLHESRAYAVPRFRLHPIWPALLAFVLVAATVAWSFSASRAEPSANSNRPIGKPRIDTPGPSGVVPTLAPDLQEAPAAETPLPDAALSSGHAGFVSIPAPEATSRSTTTQRTRRQKSGPPAAAKPAPSSMYERYP